MHFPRYCVVFITISLLLVFIACKKDKSLPSPAGLTFSNISDTGCTINWTPVSNVVGYKITISTDSLFARILYGYNELVVTNSQINLTTLTPYSKYFVKIIAYDNNNRSNPVNGSFMTADADALVIIPWENKDLYAFDARNGNVKWSFGGAPIVATPIIQDSVVYIGGMDGRLYALNVANGSQKWRTDITSNGAIYTANALIKNGLVYIGDYRGRCHAYRVSDGAAVWSYDIPSPYANINSSPVLNGNTIYFASYDGKIYALDANTGAYKWATVSTGNPIASGMALVNGYIYVGTSSNVYAFDAGSGSIKWISSAPKFTQFDASPTLNKDTVFIGGMDGNMYAFNALDGAVFWTKNLGAGSIMSSPAYSNGIVFTGDGEGITYALASNSGNIIWNSSVGGSTKNVYSGPTLSARALYTASLEGSVEAFDMLTGAVKWIKTMDAARFSASPSVITYKGDLSSPGLSGAIQ
jgi:outer membrane protein assembly factor BamB